MYSSNGYVLDESPRRLGSLAPVPDADRSDRDAMWRRLRERGYLYLPGFLDPDEVLAFREYYFSALGETGLADPATDPVVGRAGDAAEDREAMRRLLFQSILPGERYAAFVRSPAIMDWFAWFLEDEVYLHERKFLRHTRPGERGVGTATHAHYDLVFLREGTDRVLSMWIPLGDCPPERGGLVYLEGSHGRVLADEAAGGVSPFTHFVTFDLPGLAEQHDERWLLADYRAGDVVVHSPHIIHAALDNVDADGIMRLSTDIRYQRASDPIDWRWRWHDSENGPVLGLYDFVEDAAARRALRDRIEAFYESPERDRPRPAGDVYAGYYDFIEDPEVRERARAAIAGSRFG